MGHGDAEVVEEEVMQEDGGDDEDEDGAGGSELPWCKETYVRLMVQVKSTRVRGLGLRVEG